MRNVTQPLRLRNPKPIESIRVLIRETETESNGDNTDSQHGSYLHIIFFTVSDQTQRACL